MDEPDGDLPQAHELHDLILVKGKKYKFTVTVKKPSLEFKNKTVVEGEEFTQSLKTAAGKKIANKKITWKTSDKKIATVSSAGVVKGIKEGTATITATIPKSIITP